MPPRELTKSQASKRNRVKNARQIRAEVSSARPEEFSESGSVLNIPAFVDSRKYEIKQLQQSMQSSKKSSSTRVFQSLPRKLRRRTASHNVKRIPKRLRNRALKEMEKSQQQFTKGTRHLFDRRKHGLSSRKLYRARMMVSLLRLAAKTTAMKLALPGNLTPANTKLRSRIRSLQRNLKQAKSGNSATILNNKLGAYDNAAVNQLAERPRGRVKYMKRQRNFVWLPTHLWNAKRSHMFKRWGFHLPWSPTQKNFRLAHKLLGNVASSDGAMVCDTSFMCEMVISNSNHNELKEAVGKLTRGRATQKKYLDRQLFGGLIYLNDECVGPCNVLWCSLEKVLIRLHPSIYTQTFEFLQGELDESKFSIQDCRFALGSIAISGAKALLALSHILRSADNSVSFQQFKSVSSITDDRILPQRTMFAFEAIDPRLIVNPKPAASRKLITAAEIIQLQDEFPTDEISDLLSKLTNSQSRNDSYGNQQTLKQLARRRQELLSDVVNSNVIPPIDSDPKIPLAIVKNSKSQQWLLILPWFWVLPFWYQLNKVSRVYHMGLKQFQQQAFELKQLNFPNDYPFTQIGYDEDVLYKKEVLQNVWERKPPAKRVNYDKLGQLHKEALVKGELGSWACCDWNLLRILQNGLYYLKFDQAKFNDPNRTSSFDSNSGDMKIEYIIDLLKLHSQCKDDLSLSITIQSAKSDSVTEDSISTTKLPVVPISLTLKDRGCPKDHARIYRIPEEDETFWDALSKGVFRGTGKADHDLERPVPHCYDLIGFITTGSYHLSEGRGCGTGFISAYMVDRMESKMVLIRNSGETTCRLAEWNQISI